MLEFLTPLSVTEGIPSGTYPVSFEDRESVAMAGFVYRNLFMGCFYMGIENGAIGNVAAVVSGTVTVERDGETYAVALDGADMAGNRIMAAFRGAVEVSDERDTGFLESAVLRGRASAAEAVRSFRIRPDGRVLHACGPVARTVDSWNVTAGTCPAVTFPGMTFALGRIISGKGCAFLFRQSEYFS